jgi:hypothetical protein
MIQTRDVIIIGTQPAALVSALVLKNQGIDFTWLKGNAPAGGIFRGISLGGQTWDAGMNLFEFTSLKPGINPDISTYNPAVRYDATRFLPQIEAWLATRVKIQTVAMPHMLVGQKTFPDLLIGNCPEYLRFLPEKSKQKIIEEISGIDRIHPLHAAQKHIAPEKFLEYSYAEIARLNHGVFLQESIIQPWLEKIASTRGEDIPALYHRQAWAPLFYPETLLQFLRDENFQLPPTEFSYSVGENFGAWMGRAEGELQDFTQPELPLQIQGKKGNWQVRTSQGILEAKEIIFAGEIQTLLQLAGEEAPRFTRGKMGFIGIEVPETSLSKAYTVLNIPDSEKCLFRMTDQTACSGIPQTTHKILGEFSGEAPNEIEIREILEVSDWIQPGSDFKIVEIMAPVSAFVLPVFENLRIFRNLQEKVQELLPEILLIGSAAELTSVSLNDQIIQGLQLPYKL